MIGNNIIYLFICNNWTKVLFIHMHTQKNTDFANLYEPQKA